jgi:hypothetical protein
VSEIASIATLITPWCRIKDGERWVISDSPSKGTISVKPKGSVKKGELACLSKCFECMKNALINKAKRNEDTFEYHREDVIALIVLRKLTQFKYSQYCANQSCLWDILEIFLRIFGGYTYKKNYNQLVNEIDRQLTQALANVKKTLNSIEKGFSIEVQAEIVVRKAEIADLKRQTRLIENFVAEHEDLRMLCRDEIEKNPDHIALDIPPQERDYDPKDEIEAIGLLKRKAIILEHLLNERLELIKRNPEILECFTKHVQAKFEGRNIEVPRIKNQVLIEEIE